MGRWGEGGKGAGRKHRTCEQASVRRGANSLNQGQERKSGKRKGAKTQSKIKGRGDAG